MGPSKNLKSKACYRRGSVRLGKLVLIWSRKIFTYLCKSTFICWLAKKSTIFREQNFKHFNLISSNLITTSSIVKGHLWTTKSAVGFNSLFWCGTWFDITQSRCHSKSNPFKSIQTSSIKLFQKSSFPV